MKTIRRKPTLSPWQCAHCDRAWYGMRATLEGLLDDGVEICYLCRNALEKFLEQRFYADMQAYWCREGVSERLRTAVRQWIADKNKEPRRPKDIYRGGRVPRWMRIALDRGLVKPNIWDVYTVTTLDDEPISVEVTQDTSTLRPVRVR